MDPIYAIHLLDSAFGLINSKPMRPRQDVPPVILSGGPFTHQFDPHFFLSRSFLDERGWDRAGGREKECWAKENVPEDGSAPFLCSDWELRGVFNLARPKIAFRFQFWLPLSPLVAACYPWEFLHFYSPDVISLRRRRVSRQSGFAPFLLCPSLFHDREIGGSHLAFISSIYTVVKFLGKSLLGFSRCSELEIKLDEDEFNICYYWS